MALAPTLALFALSLAGAGYCLWRERRPRDLSEPPPLVPLPLLAALCVLFALAFGAHLISLATGQPFVGRFAR